MFGSNFVRDAAADEVPETEQISGFLQLVCFIKQLVAEGRDTQLDSQSVMQHMELPLSDATAVWQGRQKVALRVVFLLKCLLGWLTPGAPDTHVIRPVTKGSSTSLIMYISKTLHECLAGKEPAPAPNP